MKRSGQKETAVRDRLSRLVGAGAPGDRLPRVRDLMAEFRTSQRVVQRALAPLIEAGQVQSRPGAGLVIAAPPGTGPGAGAGAGAGAGPDYEADCLILYRASESRLARTLLIELVARLKKKGYRAVLQGFGDEATVLDFIETRGRFRCCLLQANFEIISVGLLAGIKSVADALVIDGVSVTGIDADVIGTNWREALSVGYRTLVAQGHARIGFLTSSHEARQIAMARREFLLLSGWEGAAPHPRLHVVPRLPGSYRKEELRDALPMPGDGPEATTALIVWGLVDGYLLDAALHERGLRPGVDVSLLLLGSVDVASEHVSRFDVVGNADAEKLDLFERVVTARIAGDTSPPKTHYLPIYLREEGSIQLLEATSPG